MDVESKDDSIDGNGSKSASRLRENSYGGGVKDLCKGDAVYDCGGGKERWDVGGGRPGDWNAGGMDDLFLTEGADVIDVILGIIGGMVGEGPNCDIVRIKGGVLLKIEDKLTSDCDCRSSSTSVADVAASMRSSQRLPWAQAAV